MLPALPDSIPLPVVAAVLVAAFVIASEIGFAAHGRFGRKTDDGDTNDEAQVLATALLLLALLLGFTFSMALGRFDTRRQMVVQEANDIGTAWLRAGLVAAPAGKPLQDKLAEYARTRVATAELTRDARAFRARVLRGAELRTEIWDLTAAATAPDPTTAQAAALVAAVNAVLDTATSRAAAAEARVPAKVVDLLIIYSVVAAFLLGYVLAARGSHHRAATLILFVLLAMTITLILDLDRPQSGDIRVSQNALTDLVAGFDLAIPARPAAQPLPVPAS